MSQKLKAELIDKQDLSIFVNNFIDSDAPSLVVVANDIIYENGTMESTIEKLVKLAEMNNIGLNVKIHSRGEGHYCVMIHLSRE